VSHEELVLNYPEIAPLRDLKIYYPPISFLLYSVEPTANPETLFLFLILARYEVEPNKDIFVGSYLLDFQWLATTSLVPTPLTSKLRYIISESPSVHFRTYDSTEELLRAADLHYRDSNHLYFFVPYLKESERDFLEKLASLIRKVKTSGRKSATFTFMLDRALMNMPEARLLQYWSDAFFTLRVNEKTGRRELSIDKLNFKSINNVPFEIIIEADSVRFQMLRSL